MSARARRGASRGGRPAHVAVLGAGATGSAYAAALHRAGFSVALWSRDPRRARSAAKRAGVASASDLGAALADADVVLLCANDGGIAELARRVAELELPARARVAFHASGAIDARVLAPLERRGFGVGALHPLVALPRGGAPDPRAFEGVGFALEARHASVRAVGRALARELGGDAFELPRGARVRYHLAATLVSNGALALFETALEELLPRALARGAGKRAFARLLASTAENLAELGPERALTGPVARGDVATVRAHLAALRTREEKELYRALARRLLAVAERGGRLDERGVRAMRRALDRA